MMVAQEKIVKIGDKDIKCMDLTYGYLLEISQTNSETKHGTVANGTGLSEDEVMALRVSEVEELYQAIMRLTYPNLYNEDGTPKPLPKEDEEDSKKKA